MKIYELIEMLKEVSEDDTADISIVNPVHTTAFNYREDKYEIADVFYYNTHNENEIVIEIEQKNKI